MLLKMKDFETEPAVPWYALQVRPRYEKQVSQVLENKGVTQYLPLYSARRQWSDRQAQVHLPLFPGYLFCRLDWSRRVLPVLTTPGVLRVLGIGQTPVPVRESEIEAIRTALSSGLNVRPWPMPRLGDTVCIERGPLEGLEGILVAMKNRSRLILSVTLLQRAVAVEIDAEWARPVSRQGAASKGPRNPVEGKVFPQRQAAQHSQLRP